VRLRARSQRVVRETGPALREGLKRLLLCGTVGALFAGGLAAAQLTSGTEAVRSVPSSPAAAGASAIPSGEVSAADWYCSSGAPAKLVLSSFSPKTVTATITRSGGGQTEVVSVPSGGQVQVPPESGSSGPSGATVTVEGGDIVAMELVQGVTGSSVAQCASTTSAKWYFPEGSTVPGDNVTLDLYDPSVTPAVVNVDVLTASGEAIPTEYQGIAVPALGIVSEILDAHATGDKEVGTIVEVDSGSIVADELLLRDSGGTRGFSDQLGTPSPESSWAFPNSVEPAGGSLVFNVMNPSSVASEVTIDATYGAGIAVHPVTGSVPAESVSSFVIGSEPGFGQNTPYAVVIKSTTPVVVGRALYARPRPVRRKFPPDSQGSTPGIAVGAESWIVPPVPSPLRAASITIQSLGRKAVKLSIAKAIGVSPQGSGAKVTTTLGPGESATVNPSVLAADAGPLLVEANGPIAVEIDASPAVGVGMVVVPAFVAG
jgi:Family of unknown function (DUF5719)